MQRIAPLALVALLAGCGGDESARTDDAAQVAARSAPAAPSPSYAPVAREIKETGDRLEFSYSWPVAVAAIEPLVKQLEADVAASRTEARATADSDFAVRGGGDSFFAHMFNREWKVEGETPRYLSLSAETATFTGGAHGMVTYRGILWDKQAGREVRIADVFANPANAYAALATLFCPKLDEERAEKRRTALPLKGEGWEVDCPDLAKQVIVPNDVENRRFEHLKVLIAPYEAGPYAEGSYEVELDLDDRVRGLIKPELREDF